MTYRDIPVLRSAGFKTGEFGQSFWGTDKNGNLWQAVEDEASSVMLFACSNQEIQYNRTMQRHEFQELFGV